MMARLYSSCSCLPKPIFLAKLPPEELPGRAGATKMSELTSSGILSNTFWQSVLKSGANMCALILWLVCLCEPRRHL